ncbi:EAL domain-containing protein [Rheinheimera sediminis]|uniref:EAL domain-containing response regulator n=1 Tax=Rheinheimera sp. YQF-1 TaxID=2499626 RepID=UPI000FD95FAB|nr:EAL domain-containing response regulator [Rheinheimera sp. YQF-1]RVT47407.1 EAL domain-containing protein [Rheinheimera sp. YQF-1]
MQNPNVLVVEDCAAQQLYAGQLLKQLKIQHISYASDGELALELLKQQRADLMLIDLDMPQMNGVELLRSLAKQQLCQAVIITSAKDALLLHSVATMAEADGLQVLGTLAKPLNKELLSLCLSRRKAEAWSVDSEMKTPLFDQKMLCKAISEQQFSLCYQPIADMNSGEIIAVEALARWNQPELGMVRPDRFIRAAEQWGLINELTLLLLDQALKQLQKWYELKLVVQLSFNLSPLSLSDTAFMQQLQHKVQQSGIKPQLICFEVTETQDFSQLSAAIESLANLRLAGFSIAIDDYGTGFANAQQLSRIPATRLKLDRSLIDGVSERSQQRLVLENTIQLAHKLGLTLIAEGVERLADAMLIKRCGIDLVQGYLYYKPLTAEDCTAVLSNSLDQQAAS